jgi:hypothetical protein
VFGLALALLTPPVMGEEKSLAAGLRDCALFAAPQARLRCFDTLAAGVTGAGITSPGAALPEVAPNSQEAGLGAEDRFGREQALVNAASSGPEALSEIQSRISALRRQENGRLVFELDNGQVWLQAESPSQALQVKVGDAVVIRRAAMGSFLLVTEHRRSTRVRRSR